MGQIEFGRLAGVDAFKKGYNSSDKWVGKKVLKGLSYATTQVLAPGSYKLIEDSEETIKKGHYINGEDFWVPAVTYLVEGGMSSAALALSAYELSQGNPLLAAIPAAVKLVESVGFNVKDNSEPDPDPNAEGDFAVDIRECSQIGHCYRYAPGYLGGIKLDDGTRSYVRKQPTDDLGKVMMANAIFMCPFNAITYKGTTDHLPQFKTKIED